MKLFQTRLSLAPFGAMALTLVLLLIACSSSTPTPTATPTPPPTPTPMPDPIANIGANSTFGDLAALLPESTTSCLRAEMGAEYDALLGRSIFDASIAADVDSVPLDCFDEEGLVSMFIAGLSQAANGLSSPTVTCLRDTFEGLDVESLKGLAAGDIESSASEAMSVGLGMLLCLTDDEAERITAESVFGESFGGPNMSLKDIRCVFQNVDITQMIALVESASSSGTPPDLSQMIAVLDALQTCGVNIEDFMAADDGSSDGSGDGSGDGPVGTIEIPTFDLSQIDQLPPELQAGVRCLIEAVGGEENAQGLLDGTYQPEASQLFAMLNCDVDLSQLQQLGTTGQERQAACQVRGAARRRAAH
jgi:hypothetical protein